MRGLRELRILIINDHQRLSPRVALEAEALSENHEVWVLNWNRSGTQEPPLSDDGLNIEWIHLKAPQGQMRLIFYLPFLYRAIIKKVWGRSFDVVHCTHLILLPISVIIGRIKKAKIVYDVYERHSITMARYFPLSRLVRFIIEWFEDQWVRRVDYVLTVDSPQDFLERRYKKNNSNVQVLYNVPPLDHHISHESLNEVAYGSHSTIVYVGGLSRDKGVLMAIEAMKRVKRALPQSHLLMIGTFHDSEQEAIELIDRYELNHHIKLIQWLPYGEMMAYLQRAQVGIALHQPCEKFLYVSKGTGRKFFTYMQAGLPIVGPEFGEIGQVVREEKCGILVDTTDPEQIAKAIIHLLENPEEARAMGQRGRRAIEEKYNWDIEKKKLLQAYAKLESKLNRLE